MTDYENAIGVMKELFGRDYQFALSTDKNNIPSSRYVDTYFDGESFYVVTYGLSKKAAEIADNPNVSLCCSRMHAFSGKAYNIGHPLIPENAGIRSALTKAFEPWYFKLNEAEELIDALKNAVTEYDNGGDITELVDQVCDNLNKPMLKENPLFARTVECLREGQL